jgi:hypothetical protein
MLIGSQIVLVFSTYFIFCSYLYDNQNTSGEKCQNYAQVVKHVTCNQYKPNISVFICNTDSIKDNKIHEGDPDEAEYRFNSETYTPSDKT